MSFRMFAASAALVLGVSGYSPTEAPSASATAAPPALEAATSSLWVAAEGNMYPGPYVLGRADAPVTLDEYADFQ